MPRSYDDPLAALLVRGYAGGGAVSKTARALGRSVWHGGSYKKGDTITQPLFTSPSRELAESYVEPARVPGSKLQELHPDVRRPAPAKLVRAAARRHVPQNEVQGYTPASAFDVNLHDPREVQALIEELRTRGYDSASAPDIPMGGGPAADALVLFPGSKAYAGGGLVAKAAKEIAEHRMRQGFYRGYAGDQDASKMQKVYVSPQRRVGERYAQRRAEQTGEEPHLEMVLADPFAGRAYGHAPATRADQPTLSTIARQLAPEDVRGVTKLYAGGGLVRGLMKAIKNTAEDRVPAEIDLKRRSLFGLRLPESTQGRELVPQRQAVPDEPHQVGQGALGPTAAPNPPAATPNPPDVASTVDRLMNTPVSRRTLLKSAAGQALRHALPGVDDIAKAVGVPPIDEIVTAPGAVAEAVEAVAAPAFTSRWAIAAKMLKEGAPEESIKEAVGIDSPEYFKRFVERVKDPMSVGGFNVHIKTPSEALEMITGMGNDLPDVGSVYKRVETPSGSYAGTVLSGWSPFAMRPHLREIKTADPEALSKLFDAARDYSAESGENAKRLGLKKDLIEQYMRGETHFEQLPERYKTRVYNTIADRKKREAFKRNSSKEYAGGGRVLDDQTQPDIGDAGQIVADVRPFADGGAVQGSEMRPAPQNALLGAIARALRTREEVQERMPRGTLTGAVMDFVLPTADTVEKLSYGDPLMRQPPVGTGGRVPVFTGDREYLAEALGMVPGVVPALRGTGRAAARLSDAARAQLLRHHMRARNPVEGYNGY